MTPSRQRNLAVALLALCVAIAAAGAMVYIGAHRQFRPAVGSAAALGEAIFEKGVDAQGRPIPRSGAGMMGRMMGGGCATCHGTDGRGASTPMYTAPNITYANLTDRRGMIGPDGSREASYTDATLKRAITQGVDPEGDRLDWPMPRWQLTDRELSDLLPTSRR